MPSARSAAQVSRCVTAILDDPTVGADDARGRAPHAIRERMDALVRAPVHDVVDVSLVADRQGLGGTQREAAPLIALVVRLRPARRTLGGWTPTLP